MDENIRTYTAEVPPTFTYHWDDLNQCYYGRFDFWQPGDMEIMMRPDGMDMVNIFKRFRFNIVREPNA